MKWNLVFGALLISAGLTTQSYGKDLLDRMLGLNHGCCQKSCCAPACEPTCCQPACEPTCCKPACEPACCQPACEPACGCESACDKCCNPPCNPKAVGYKASCCRTPAIFKDFGKLFEGHHGCCNNGCGSSCCEPACEAACEPACGCANACEPACGCETSCCKKSCGGLLSHLFKHKSCCKKSCGNGCGNGCSSGCNSCGNGHSNGAVHGGEAAPMPPAPMADPSASVRRTRPVVPASRVIRN